MNTSKIVLTLLAVFFVGCLDTVEVVDDGVSESEFKIIRINLYDFCKEKTNGLYFHYFKNPKSVIKSYNVYKVEDFEFTIESQFSYKEDSMAVYCNESQTIIRTELWLY